MLRKIAGLSLLLLLCACGTTAGVQAQFREPFYGATHDAGFFSATPGLGDPRLRDPHFYMDDESTPRWLLMTGQPNR